MSKIIEVFALLSVAQVNGQSLNGDRTLMHKDRILFGSNHMYVYYDAASKENKESAEGTPDYINWDFAQKEIAQAKGFQTGSDGQLSKGSGAERVL